MRILSSSLRLSRKPFRQHIARPGAGPCAWPSPCAAEIEPGGRRRVARVACNRAKEEVLVEMMASCKIVAADQAGVFALEVEGRPDRAPQDLGPQARRVDLENIE